MPPKSGIVLSYIKNDPPENSEEDDDDELQTYEDDDYEILKSFEYETDEDWTANTNSPAGGVEINFKEKPVRYQRFPVIFLLE